MGSFEIPPIHSSSSRIKISTFQRIGWIFNTFYYQIVATFTIVLFWLLLDQQSHGRTPTAHLVLSTAAYIPLMAVSIILFSEDNITTLYIPRTNRNWIHGTLLLISALFVTIGIGIEIHHKTHNKQKHFHSLHAIYGLVSWLLVFVSLVLGVIAANGRSLSSYVRPIVSKLIHNFLGLAAFLFGILSLWMERRGIKRYFSESGGVGFEIAMIFITVVSILAAVKSLFFQVKGTFS